MTDMTDMTDTTRAPDSPTRRATIEDVATAAGVSVATVSRALRGLPNVAESTRIHVCATATALAYHPDPAASRLAAGKTGTLTVAVPSLNSWYFSNVVAGAEAVCAEAGLEFQVIGLSSIADRNRLLSEERRLERRTDSLILVDIKLTDEQVASLDRRGIAVATIGSRVAGHPSVCIDDHAVGRMAAMHLISLGHEKIALIDGLSDDPMNFDVPKARRRGFISTLAEHGLHLDPAHHASGNFGTGGGYEAMSQILLADDRPTAVFAMSDEMAFGALLAFREHGVQAGTDISIIGVDDHEFARVVELTTIRQWVPDHGARAARLLMAAVTAERDTPCSDPVDTVVHAATEVEPAIELVVRATTGAPVH